MRSALAVVAGAGLALGVGATGASAYSISGGTYVGSATSDPSFTLADVYTITCPAASSSFAGTAGGWPVTYFRPYYGGVDDCDFFGLPAEVKQDGSWGLTVNSGPSSGGAYTGDLHIPAVTTTTIEVPLAGCTVTITGTQNFVHGSGWNVVSARNVLGGMLVAYGVDGLSYTASGCPFSSGSDGSVTTTFVAVGPTVS